MLYEAKQKILHDLARWWYFKAKYSRGPYMPPLRYSLQK
jgi:hypothetical protein